jgi:sodium-dependent dicarboxylate transporter 2/3/5
MTEDSSPPPWWIRVPALLGGPIAALAIMRAAGGGEDALSPHGEVVLGLMAWMAVWWLFQAVPIAVTALLPPCVLPIAGVQGFAASAAPFASDIIFLFAGGCLLAAAIDRHGLGRRFAAAILSVAGRSPASIVGAFMAVSASLSAVVSNTATVAIVLPLALGAISFVEASAVAGPDRARLVRRFAIALLLGVAYGANIGGCLTIVGSPPNAIGAKLLAEATGEPVSFVGWMAFGGPVVLSLLPLTWLLLCKVLLPLRGLELGPSAELAFERGGPIEREGWFTLVVFLATVLAWVTRPLWPETIGAIGDWGIATAAAALLLVVPLRSRLPGTALVAEDLQRLPWGVFILFGGGLSLAASMRAHGVDLYLGSLFTGLEGLPPWLVILAVVAAVVFLTEVTSNTAVASATIPVLIAIAPVLSIPVAELAVTVAIAASLAFMLPVGTPPNALVFSSGRVPVGAMMRAGLAVNLVSIAVLTLLSRLLL